MLAPYLTNRWRCLCCLWGLTGVLFCPCLLAQTLSEVVQQALLTYPALATAQAKTDAARADTARARSAHFPQLGAGLSANSYASGRVPSAVGKTTASPTAKVNVWAGGRIQAETQRAQALTAASQARQQLTQEDVALQACEAYLNWSKTADLYLLSLRNLQSHRLTLEDIRTIAQVDVGRRMDLQQAQLRLDNAQLSVDQRRSDVDVAVQRLQRFWAGALSAQPAGVTDASGEGDPLAAVPSSLDQATQGITEQWPALAQYRAEVLAAEAAVRQAQGLHWPTVDLLASRQFNSNTLRFDTLTQLQLNMPIYNGHGIQAQVEAATAQLTAAQATLDEAHLTLREKVAAAWQEWSSLRSRAQLGLQQSDVGDKVVDGYRQQFRLARRSLLELLNIQADAFTYRSNALAAVHDERIARARLLASMGALSERFDPRGIQFPDSQLRGAP